MGASMSGLTRLKLERLRIASERLKSSISKALLTAGKLGWFNSALTVLVLYWIRLVAVGVEAPEGALENAPLATIIENKYRRTC